MIDREKMIIVGAGGYAKSALDSLDRSRYAFCGFIDERIERREHLGYPVVAHCLEGLQDFEEYTFFIAIGNNKKRKVWFEKLKSNNCRISSIVDSTAIVSPLATLGEGCFVGKHAIVNAGSVIGSNVIVNTMALVEHGCVVHSHANISTKAVINGDVEVGEGSFLGSGSITIGQVSIGCWTILGAGSVVIGSIPDGVTAVGTPARVVKEEANYW